MMLSLGWPVQPIDHTHARSGKGFQHLVWYTGGIEEHQRVGHGTNVVVLVLVVVVIVIMSINNKGIFL